MKKIGLIIIGIMQLQSMAAQTAEEIISKYIEAIGGYEKIKAIKTMIYEGITRTRDYETHFKSYVINDSASHTDNISNNGESGYLIVTKTESWGFNAVKNTIEKKTEKEVKYLQYALDLQGPFIDYKQKKSKIKYLGKEIIDSKEYSKVRLIKHNKDRLTYYFDSSYFILRAHYEPSGIYGPVYTIDYSYQAVDGGYFFTYKFINYERQSETIYTSIKVNPEIDRALFLPHNVNKRDSYH